MADVFISYANEDRAIAEKIAAGLSGAGFSVWWDRHLLAGVRFQTEIKRQIEAARAVVVLWSAASEEADWVHDEATLARDENKLIPALIDAVRPPLGFRQVQSLDLRGWQGDPTDSAFAGLLAALRRLLGGISDEPRLAPPSTVDRGDIRFGGKRWLLTGGLVLVMGAIALLYILARPGTTPAGDIHDGRIEIDAFEPLTKTAELERFARAVTDTVVRVFTTNGINAVVGGRIGADTGARSSTPEFVLRGTADRDGDAFVVSADIVHSREGVVLYSMTLQRDAAQPRRLEDQFSMSVAGVLSCALRFRNDAKNDPSPDLFGALLRICAAFGGSIEQTPELARRIVQMAPQYAISYALRADANASVSNLDGKTPEEVARLRKMVYDDAKIAEQMDPTVDSYIARATVYDPSVGLAERERLLQKSLAVNPAGGYAWRQYGDFLQEVGRIDEALDHYERAVSVDLPGSGGAMIQSAIVAAGRGNIEFARKRFEDARATALPDGPIDFLRFWAELWFGDGSIAKKLNEDPNVFFFEGRNKAKTLGSDSCSAAFIDARVRNARPSEAELDAACPDGDSNFYGYFGYVDAALRQWEAGVDAAHPMFGNEFLFMSFNRTIRADPRFMHLAARKGLVDYWLDTDKWPDFCKDEKLSYDCKEAALAARANAAH